jgi:hypothetical protein
MYVSDKSKPHGLVQMNSTWGEHPSPFIQYDPDDYQSRNFPVAGQWKGTSSQPGMPHPTGVGTRYGEDPGTSVTNPTSAPAGPNKIVWLILFGIGFLLAYHMGKSAGRRGARSNPGTRRRRAPEWQAVRAVRKRPRSLVRFANARPRNELGQFLPLA